MAWSGLIEDNVSHFECRDKIYDMQNTHHLKFNRKHAKMESFISVE